MPPSSSTTHVPVGDDQSQHIELAKEIARSMNAQYKAELFAIPKAIICNNLTGAVRILLTYPATLATGTGASRVMSLRDGRAKMSKSDPTDATRINLDDTPDQIAQKVRHCQARNFIAPPALADQTCDHGQHQGPGVRSRQEARSCQSAGYFRCRDRPHAAPSH